MATNLAVDKYRRCIEMAFSIYYFAKLQTYFCLANLQFDPSSTIFSNSEHTIIIDH